MFLWENLACEALNSLGLEVLLKPDWTGFFVMTFGMSLFPSSKFNTCCKCDIIIDPSCFSYSTKRSSYGDKNLDQIGLSMVIITLDTSTKEQLAANRGIRSLILLNMSNGEWCSDDETLCDKVGSYFQSLFAIDSTPIASFPCT
ncbi:hypothetical protein V6N13_091104 [Hibiscus sabdariffa]